MTIQSAAIIVAGGRGSRLRTNDEDLPKQYQHLDHKTILTHTLETFLNHSGISQVIVVRHQDDLEFYENAIACLKSDQTAKLLPAAIGRDTRQGSVLSGLKALESMSCDFVLIHDAARPFVPSRILDDVIEKLNCGETAILTALPVVDTLKRYSPDNALETVDRAGLWAAQTPQAFDFEMILSAHERAKLSGKTDFTDDTAIAEWIGVPVTLVEGHPDNFKITTPADLVRARKIAHEGHLMTQTPDTANSTLPPLEALQDVRMGTGYDVHAFDQGDAVILGGVAVPHDKKLKGHSDADVVLHALTDAILGAIGDGDIGAHFPPSDPKWKGAASDLFLIDAIRRVTELGGRIAHLDATIICEAPKIGPHRENIRTKIAQICDLPVSRVSVKATTSEKLGFTGRGEGIATMASATVRLPF
ncbi:MAG: bifunctional 2-C-methyl-D-erythritol 4-phosphate cytidylyltransferase/2-C-methyl-D-erythritol 2,4-cyclodiphosphate synthase [Rhodobacteraceae bacterium]|nr:bifunctional 2-C-methyl-D-erythritol 4-phosphate cytidylyltransferase/2-C-methyl-D-erythritol 2,4-cyclodiphosphate synthase [Paracoccaceae bacterium]